MKQVTALAFSVFLAMAPPLRAEEPGGDMGEGMSLLEEGARLFLRGLADEMEPALKGLAENIEPAMRELLNLVDDFNAYELPEMLPNGDIIIRRKRDLPETPPEGDIEI